MTWAAGVARNYFRSCSTLELDTSHLTDLWRPATCAGAALDHACRRFVLPWAGHVCWSAVCGDRRPLAVKARPGPPPRCALWRTHRPRLGGELVCGRPPAPLRASTPPQRRTPGLYRAQRAALFTLIIHKKATIIKARTTSASVCAPTETGHSGQRTSLQRQRRRRPRVGHRHAPEGEKENPRLARNGSEERTKGKESARLKRGRPAAPRPRRPRRVSGRRDGGAAPFSRCTRRRRSGTPR